MWIFLSRSPIVHLTLACRFRNKIPHCLYVPFSVQKSASHFFKYSMESFWYQEYVCLLSNSLSNIVMYILDNDFYWQTDRLNRKRIADSVRKQERCKHFIQPASFEVWNYFKMHNHKVGKNCQKGSNAIPTAKEINLHQMWRAE